MERCGDDFVNQITRQLTDGVLNVIHALRANINDTLPKTY